MRDKIYLAIIVVSSIYGCAVGPDFVSPDADVASQWFSPVEENLSKGPIETAAWWESFGDPDLNRLVDVAFKNNLSLQIAALRVLEARAQLGFAKGLLFPQRQELGGRALGVGLSDHAPNMAIANQSYWDFQVGFDAVWELDFWGRFRRGIEATKADYIALQANYDNALVTVTAEVARLYIIEDIRTTIKICK